MNSVLKKLAKRNIKQNIRQFTFIIAIVFLCTMLISGLISSSKTLESVANKYFERTNLADIWLNVSGVSEDDEQFFEDNEIVYTKRFYIETTALINTKGILGNAKIYVYDGKISTPEIEEGVYLEIRETGCLIDKKVVENYDLKLRNDEVTFDFQLFDGSDDVTISLNSKINGSMCLSEEAETSSSWPIFFSETEFLTIVNEFLVSNGKSQIDKIPYNQVLIKTDDCSGTLKKIADYYEYSSSTLVNYYDRTSVESVKAINDEVLQAKKMILIFPMIFLIVSILIIMSSIEQLIFRESKKIGTLKSIGVSDKKILNHYSFYGVRLCLIGGVFGSLFGFLIIPRIMFVKYNLIFSIPSSYIKIQFPVIENLIIVFIMMVVGYLSSMFACLSILKKPPIFCLKGQIESFGVKPKLFLKSNKISFEAKLILRNIFSKPVKTLMVILGMAGCTALLISSFGIGDTLNKTISNDFDKLFNYDIVSTYKSDTFVSNLDDNGFSNYEKFSKAYSNASFGDEKYSADFYVISQNSTMVNVDLSNGQTCISQGLANRLGVDVGDKIMISISGKTVTRKINALVQTGLSNIVFVCDDLDFGEANFTNGVWIKTEFKNENSIQTLNSINGTNGAYLKEGVRENEESKILSIKTLTKTLRIFAIFLIIIVILNFVTLNLNDKKKEISTYRALGKSIFSISVNLIIENLIVVFIGFCLGAAVSYPLLLGIIKVNALQNINFIVNLKFLSIFYSFLICFGFVFALSCVEIYFVRKIKFEEVLKTFE